MFLGNQAYVHAQTALRKLALHPNYPNPFEGTTTIGYAVREAMNVRLEVYNVLGQWIAVLVDAPQKETGFYRVR